MAQLAPIAVNDGASTPVTHTFTPIGKPSGSLFDVFANRVNGKAAFQEELRLKSTQPAQSGQPYRVAIQLLDPTTAVVNGVEGVDFLNRVNVEFILAANGTMQSRKDLRVMLLNALSNAIVVGAVDNLENTY